jgi:energy-coupling factor transporter ATP-binding protein EcfA2
MRFITEQSSAWMGEFHKQLMRGKHVLLHGNIADMYLLSRPADKGATSAGVLREDVSLAGFLDTYFQERGYRVVGRYDRVDGLRFARPQMRADFDAILSGAAMPAVSTAPVVDLRSARDAGDRQTNDRLPQDEALMLDPQTAIEQVRLVVAQSRQPAAFVLEFADMLADGQLHDAEERALVTRLAKLLNGSAIATSSDGRSELPNVVVFVASQPGRVPAWLYRDNSRLALVQVDRPTAREREHFIKTYLPNFNGSDKVAGDEARAKVVEEFTDLTDGFTTLDLNALRLMSRAEGLPVTEVRGLVDYFKYGTREDRWQSFDAERLRQAAGTLSRRVIGQPVAIQKVVGMLTAAHSGLSLSPASTGGGAPKGVFFFVGPTGVGKTELAKALADLIFNDEGAFLRLDMSEFAQEHAAEKLIGSPPGYVGHEEGGVLTNYVRQKPFCVLLFDEIDKADPKVMDKFLQVLSDGRLTDGRGQTVYFSQALLIFTSNTGAESIGAAEDGGALPPYKTVLGHFRNAVRTTFTHVMKRPELYNRLGDNIVVFDLLRPVHVPGICGKFLSALADSASKRCNLRLRFDSGGSIEQLFVRIMMRPENVALGGRRIGTAMETLVRVPLSRWIFENAPAPGSEVIVSAPQQGEYILVNGTPVYPAGIAADDAEAEAGAGGRTRD